MDIQDILELTPLQQGLLFHALRDPKSPVYLEQLNCTLRGELDVTKFQLAWGHVVSRHDALRTAVQWEDLEKPYQIVYGGVSLPFKFEDWTRLSSDEQNSSLSRMLEEDRSTGFELTRAPLMRVSVIKMAEQRHQLLFAFHHLLLDGWSLVIVISEVFRAYEAYLAGSDPDLGFPHSFREYASWLQQQDLERAERFWRNTLKGFVAPNILRTEPERGATSDYARRKIHLQASLSGELEKVARQLQVTVNTLVQASWGILLSRYTAQEDVVWGSTVSGRPAALPGVEKMVGIFINTLPLRAQVKSDRTFPELAAELQQLSGDITEYEYTPLTLVQKWSEVPRSGPLFESLVVFENYPVGDSVSKLGGSLEIENPRAFERTNYPLSLLVVPGTELSLEFFYETTRFGSELVDRMLRQMEFVLAQVAETPHRTLGSISLLDESDREVILCAWNQTAVLLSDRSTIHDLYEQHAARTPAKVAVTFEREQLTYAELNSRANQLAHLLQMRGVRPGVLVGLLVERSLNSIVGVLGILKAGAAYVPIDSSYPLERLQYVIRDAGLSLVLTSEDLAAKILDTGATFVCFDRDAALLSSQPTTNLGRKAGERDPVYAIYTSGSTGRPKGVILEHRGLTNVMEAQLRAFDLTPNDRVFQFASLAYDASIFEIAMAWRTGATLCLASAESTLSPIALVQQLRSQRVTNLTIPPSVLATISDFNLPDLRTIVVAGEACPAELVQKWAKGRRFFNAYGPTETTVWATVAECKDGVERPPIGRPITNVQIYILDSELRPVPVGVAGELHVGGAGVGRGYINRPELTAQRFVPDIFSSDPTARLYKSGDLARWLPDGNVEYIGRMDHQVKLRGFRLELEEIEAVLVQCPGVVECAVLLRGDPGREKRLVAYLVLAADNPPTVPDIREFLRKQLPHFMVPTTFVPLDVMPLTTNGKIDRRALPVPTELTGLSSSAPQSALEREIAEVWKNILNLEEIGRDDNFFDLGGHSLLLTQMQTRLKKATGHSVSVMDLFRHATVRSLAAHIFPEPKEAVTKVNAPAEMSREPIAVVGMAGRFPNAPSIDAFWQKLRDGEECITQFTQEELQAGGVDPELLAQPNYVKAGGKLTDVEMFDGNFFGFSPREVESIDPQHRLFLETAHQALEHAGCDPMCFDGRIAVYGGSTYSAYMANNLLQNPDAVAAIGHYQIGIGNHKDFLATRVSYKLNLTGPAVAVQATCCTSLVAIHYACQGLWTNEAEMALAGGVTVLFPHPSGYLYHEEGILSPDGHCRAFDAKAKGTVPGNGVAVVALKRLSRALQDGDTIHAVILASATNNDGASKVGYTAPSVDGQAAVIRSTHEMAGITSDSVGYVEAHGTGTSLGDPIEIAALTQAFRATSDAKQFCAVGSVKTNAGHLDCAAGVTGFIKAVLQLKHGQIVPNLHFESPNPKIDFANSPFFVSNRLREWKPKGLRRAGVSSFGIGGTNVHVLLQEAPATETTKSRHDLHLLTFSAKTATALDTLTANHADFLASHPDLDVADIAFTQHVGRTAHPYRRVALVHDTTEASRILASKNPQAVFTARNAPAARSVVFLFSGQGAQYVNMGRELYEREPLFRGIVDDCSRQLHDLLGRDLRDLLFPSPGGAEEALKQTRFTQPALFVVEYALARLWMSWGVRPAAMLGHSIGEYVAACLSGVMEFCDALRLVALRGRLMQTVPPGAMLALPISEADARALLPPGASIAAVNAPAMCVASGPLELIDELECEAKQKNIDCRRLHTSHAFHSPMMDPILSAFGELIRRVKFSAPKLPYISNVTGTWITEQDVTDPDYWMRHIRHTVRFSEGLMRLVKEEPRIFLEVGPGQALITLARQHPDFAAKNVAFGSLRHPNSRESDLRFLLTALGRLWLAGADVDWKAYHADEKRRRVPLPTYPFEHRRYFVEPRRSAAQAKLGAAPLRKRADIADWFYVPSWKRAPFSDSDDYRADTCLVFADDTGLADALACELRHRGDDVTVVRQDSAVASNGAVHLADPESAVAYSRLLHSLKSEGKFPAKIVHLWGVTGGVAVDLQTAHKRGFFSLMALSQALTEHAVPGKSVVLCVITDGAQNVNGTELLNPEKALISGIVNVLSQELQNSSARWIDVDAAAPTDQKAKQLIRELSSTSTGRIVAHRGAYRWMQTFECAPLRAAARPSTVLRERGVYLITGGMGGMGLVLGKYLAEKARARLILVGRSPIPDRSEWDDWLNTHDGGDSTSAKIRGIREIESAGADVFVASADVAHLAQMRNVVARAESRFGAVHGVIHAAGVPGGEILQAKTIESAHRVMLPKVEGTLVLDQLFSHPLDFVVLSSSLASVAAGFGQSDYAAANAFLDAYAHAKARKGERVVSMNWDNWSDIGMAVNVQVPAHLEAMRRDKLKEAISSEDGAEAFARALQSGHTQVFVSTKDLNAIMLQIADAKPPRLEAAEEHQKTTGFYPRPPLETPCVEPRNSTEAKLVEIWQELLGVQPIGIYDNFFDLGGHSLLATQVIARLHHSFSYDMPLRKLFESPTIAGIAELISGAATSPEEDVQGLLKMLAGLTEEEAEAEVEKRLSARKEAAHG